MVTAIEYADLWREVDVPERPWHVAGTSWLDRLSGSDGTTLCGYILDEARVIEVTTVTGGTRRAVMKSPQMRNTCTVCRHRSEDA